MVHAQQLPNSNWHDRPGWIPADITDHWDDDPYAYQTEEEAMPAGGLHNFLSAYIMEMLRIPLQANGLMLMMDNFMLYRDLHGTRRRIGPDLLLCPFQSPPLNVYNLDHQPPPALIIEVTSPKSLYRDIHDKVDLYSALAVESYLVIDAVKPDGTPKHNIELRHWHRRGNRLRPTLTTNRSHCTLPPLGFKIEIVDQSMRFIDLKNGLPLRDGGEWRTEADRESRRADDEAKQKVIAQQRADEETIRADDQAKQKVFAERRADDQAKQKVIAEQRAAAAEAELLQLRELLHQSQP